MNVKDAYNRWAAQYDTNKNRTRDLEAVALKTILPNAPFERCLEIGCGTGKNTGWLLTRAKQLTGVDLSEEMLAKARLKHDTDRASFIRADITEPWSFAEGRYNLATFSLVLEHIEDLDPIFGQLRQVLHDGGLVYIGELHPFKQYSGTKARFETADGVTVVPCYDHHLSDFTGAARRHGFTLLEVSEFFDDDDRTTLPRILSLLLKKDPA